MARTARHLGPDHAALLLIAATVVVANLLFLLDFFDPNPLAVQSGLWDFVHHGVLGGQQTIDPTIGYSSQALGHRAALDLLHLHLPWWNPFEGTGVPLAGEMQSAALFPPTLLVAIGNGQLYEHMLLELVAGAGTYLLLRRIEIRRSASAAAAIAFALNGTFAWLGNATVNPVAFLPLLLLGVEHAYAASAGGRRGGWWLIAVAGALSVYAGFPEVAYVDGLLAVLWLVWRGGCLPRSRRRTLITKTAAGALAGLLLSAPLLIAFLTFLPHAFVGPHAGGEHGSLPAQGLPALLMPYVYGPVFQFADRAQVAPTFWGDVGGYLTTSLALFGAFGLLSPGRRGLRWLLGVWILLSIARIYGEPPLIGHVLGLIPGMSSVEFRRYSWPALELAVVILAALGIDRLAERALTRRQAIGIAGGALAIVGVAALAAYTLVDRVVGTGGQYHYFELATVGAGAVVIASAVISVLGSGRLRLRLAATLVALDALVMFSFAELSAPRAVKADFGAARYLQAHLGQGRFYSLGVLKPNYGAYFGLASINLNDLPIPANLATYIHTRIDPVATPYLLVGTRGQSGEKPSSLQEALTHLTGYQAAGVSYLVAQPETQLPSTFKLVYRNPTAWIYSIPGAAPFFSASGSGCTIAPRGFQLARVQCLAGARLVRRETYLAGWSAQVDGRSVPLQRAGLFQSVTIPAGAHTVSFSYAPPGVTWAFVALAAGWILLVVGCGPVRARLRVLAPPRIRGRTPARPRIGDRPPREPQPPPQEPQPPPREPHPSSSPPAATPSSQTAPTRGHAPSGRVERAVGGVVTGWAWCPDAPAWRLGVRAVIGDREVARTIADLPRPSLRDAGIGDGSHGFRISLPAGATEGERPLRIETASGIALPAATGSIADVALDLTGTRTTPPAVGYVEHIDADQLRGWVWYPSFPELRAAVWLVYDGRLVGAVIADMPRPSLVAAGIGDGRYGFRFSLPPELRAGSVRVETEDGSALRPVRAFAGNGYVVDVT